MTSTPATVPSRQIAFDYDRTVVAFHGTRRSVAEKLVAGTPFGKSENDDDWLGHGIYFWEYAPQQAWWWAERRYGADEALGKGLPRLWERSGVFRGAHIQLSVREPTNILAVWPVRRDGRYGKD